MIHNVGMLLTQHMIAVPLFIIVFAVMQLFLIDLRLTKKETWQLCNLKKPHHYNERNSTPKPTQNLRD